MDSSLIYSKTATGMAELGLGARGLDALQARALARVDGAASVGSLAAALGAQDREQLIGALRDLERMALIRAVVEIDPQLLAQQLSVPDHEPAPDGTIPAIEVIELSPQESVQAWAEAQRGARALQEKGFYATGRSRQRVRDAATIRVLVVEDDDATAQVLEFLLREHGFVVKRAADGRAALTELQRRPLPDVVLLDVMLPGHDGFDVLRGIRADAALQQLPVIMVTAKISDADVMRGLKEGADGYVFKPFQWETLHGCIGSVCGGD